MKLSFKRLAILSFALNIAIILYSSFHYYRTWHYYKYELNDSMVEYSYNKIIVNKAIYDCFKKLPQDTTDIIFLGCSITAGFPIHEMFQNIHLKNRGIGGNTSKDILNRLDEITDGKPAKIFLEIGINDISQGVNEDSLLNNVNKIYDIIKEQSPRTKLYIQSVFPTCTKPVDAKIEEYNKKLSNWSSIHNLTYMDFYSAFLKNGILDPSLTTDGLHFNYYGYSLWKSQIEKYVE